MLNMKTKLQENLLLREFLSEYLKDKNNES